MPDSMASHYQTALTYQKNQQVRMVVICKDHPGSANLDLSLGNQIPLSGWNTFLSLLLLQVLAYTEPGKGVHYSAPLMKPACINSY